MKKIILLLLLAPLVHSCALKSITYIGPKKEFELGDGKHGAFRASVLNDGSGTVEIYKQQAGEPREKVGSLAPGQKSTIAFAADTKAIFKNLDTTIASLKLKVTGDTGLSMGGPNYN